MDFWGVPWVVIKKMMVYFMEFLEHPIEMDDNLWYPHSGKPRFELGVLEVPSGDLAKWTNHKYCSYNRSIIWFIINKLYR